MKLSSSAQMREIDRYAIEEIGIPGAALMSAAAEHVAAAALEHLPLGGCAAAVCGVGNNGGDGIGAAACLMEKGAPVRVFLVGNEEKLTADSREMLRRLTATGGKLERFSGSDEEKDYLNGCDVIIDAMFGIGLNSGLRGDALLAAETINASRALVIAADIPSGVNADTGVVPGGAVSADITVTFTCAKPGHFVEPGCTLRGELRVRDIGIPQDIITHGVFPEIERKNFVSPSPTPYSLLPTPSRAQPTPEVYAVMPEDIHLPHRRPDSHKGDYGRCLIVSGSVGYTGAPALCARAASRMGAGLVFLGVPEPIYEIMAGKLDEEMPFPLPYDGNGRLAANAVDELIRRAGECDAVLIGPGLGRSPEITELVATMIRSVRTPIILDADGINAISDDIGILSKASCPLILTPHPGEFMRTGGDLSSGDRLRAARDFAQTHRCVIVLKGHRTITALPDGTVYINTTGGPAMAKGGSGDVLAGMIAALVGQKFSFMDAAVTAVYLHGLSGDFCAAEYGEYSVTAGDIITMLPKASLSLQRRH